jgi:hypothetical protein
MSSCLNSFLKNFPIDLINISHNNWLNKISEADTEHTGKGELIAIFLEAIVEEKNSILDQQFTMLTNGAISILEEKLGQKGLSQKAENIFFAIKNSIEKLPEQETLKRKARDEESVSANKLRRTASDSVKKEAPKRVNITDLPKEILGLIGTYIFENPRNFWQSAKALNKSRVECLRGDAEKVNAILRKYNWDLDTLEDENPHLYADLVEYRILIKTLDFSIAPALSSETLSRILEFYYRCESIYLTDNNISTEALELIATKCPKLRSLNLEFCSDITDTGLEVVAQNYQMLNLLNIGWCENITDTGVQAIVRKCLMLQSLSVEGCDNITNTGLEAIAQNCRMITLLNLGCCQKITYTGVQAIVRKCLMLQSLNVEGCDNITDSEVQAIEHNCHMLQSLNL